MIKIRTLRCEECGKDNYKILNRREFGKALCDSCLKMYKKNPFKYIPPKGELHTDEIGRVICHECGRSFHKLTIHIKTRHNMSAEEYKEKHGLNRTTRLTSKSLQEKFRNNQAVNIATVRKPFEKGHSINVGKKKRLEAIKNIKAKNQKI